jgi:hypothetical protein
MVSTTNRKILIGILVAPLVATVALWFVMLLVGGREANFWFLFMLPTAYGCSLVFGIPAHLALRRYLLVRSWHYALAGIMIGIVPALVVWAVDRASELIGVTKILAVFGIVLGPTAAVVFWMIAVRQINHYPHRDTSP